MAQNPILKYYNFFLQKQIFRQFFKYSVVGVFNTIIGLGTIFILYNIYHVNYILSNVSGYSLGLINSFIWNKKWTFRSDSHYSKEIFPFLIIFIVSYIANLVTVILSVEALKINANVSQILGIGSYTITNFSSNRKWTFSKKTI